ncbi:hypothetical protein C2845_PM06G14480 [Panicum miliaceum]|uniref:Complex III subunit VI n=1 Tax=Panicum miliaceum TaxID=4540 RepID=A0A3L6RGD2_PANMI|nr:hypothetical protein C2845_PM06G14480 [Panicum miliaceum]
MDQQIGFFASKCRADTEPVDPKNYLEERCKPQCVKSLYDYERCMKRVENDDSGQKHCTGQYFDYWSCVDKCEAVKARILSSGQIREVARCGFGQELKRAAVSGRWAIVIVRCCGSSSSYSMREGAGQLGEQQPRAISWMR